MMESLSTNDNVNPHSDEITRKEYLQACCRLKYQPRRLKNKGAILLLVWNFLAVFATKVVLMELSRIVRAKFAAILVQCVIGLMLPIAGWLADIRFGRYKSICWSIWTMWSSCMLLATSYVVVNNFESYNHYNIIIFQALVIALTILHAFGFGGFQANIIQFGVDQLTDASTTEITSFIAWYTWSTTSSEFLLILLSCIGSEYLTLLAQLIVCTSLTVVVSSNYLFNNHLVKEPVTQNPFWLIYKVVQYAIRNKHPRQRSAFTFCEDDPPSRIDFGKSKYGGPFTTEQVEDVKTFFRIIGLVSICGAVYAMRLDYQFFPIRTYVHKEFTSAKKSTDYNQCLHNGIPFMLYSICVVVSIPLNEIFIYPIFRRCSGLKSHFKIIIGAITLLLVYTLTTVLFTYSRKAFIETSLSHNDTSIKCLFREGANSLNYMNDFKLLSIPECLFAISEILLIIGIIEYYCAQVPYSMKGLLAGCYYACLELFVALDHASSLPFTTNLFNWTTGTIYSCGFWYFQTKIILMVIAVFLCLLTFKFCKKRKREDVLPNEHIFAERYYSSDY